MTRCAWLAVATDICLLVWTCTVRPCSALDVREEFNSPGNGSRMLKIVHGWSDDQDAVRKALDQIAAEGYGGVVTNVNFGDGYTDSDRNWHRFLFATEELRRRKMTAWLYDECGYPSGRADGLVLRDHPELEVKGLLVAHRQVGSGAVEFEMPPGKLLLAEAYPIESGTIQLQRRVSLEPQGRVVRWSAPAGHWEIIVITVDRLFEGTQVACSGYPEQSPYVGLMEPGLTRRFMEKTHDRYVSHMGQDLRQTFTATFTDEPSTMAIYFNQMQWAVLPWCSDFPEQFRARRGYDLLPRLSCLVAEGGDAARKVRTDFYRTVSDLMVERWWEPLRSWAKANGVQSGGHLLLEENILHHVPLYGSAFEAFRHMDSPGIDCLSSDPTVPRYTSMAGMGADIPWNAARLASSVAELYGKPYVMCEVSEHIQNAGGTATKLTEAHYRGTWARLMLGGVNVFTSYHSFPGWSEERIRAANDWIGRCMALMREGHRVAQVAVVYPTETVWNRFTPSNLWVEQASQECRCVEQTLRDLSEALYRDRREFDYIDGRVLSEGTVTGKALTYRDHRWSAIVLPDCDTLPEPAWRKLAAFARAGGVVVVLGNPPRNCLDHLPCKTAQAAARVITERGRGLEEQELRSASKVPALLDRALPAGILVEAGSPIRMTHRRTGNREVWFLLNDSLTAWSGSITIPNQTALEVWNPQDGSVRVTASDEISVKLAGYDVLIVCGDAQEAVGNPGH